MQVGVHFPLESFAGLPDFARRSEALGFDYLACGERLASYVPTLHSFVTLAAAAAVTTRIKLLSSVIQLPLYPAALVAKMAATLDVISGGRYNLGVGVGGENPKEFEACGVPPAERGARTNEALQVIHRLFTEPVVHFAGKFNTLSGMGIAPRPLQQPRPPIWVAGRNEAAMRRAARFGDYWLPYMYSPEQLRESLATVERYSRECGRKEAGRPRGAIMAFTTVYPDGEKARRVCTEFLGRAYQQDFTRMIDRYLIVGTPEQCRQRLHEYKAAGAEVMIASISAPPEDTDEMLRRLAEEVIPAVR